MLFSLRSNMEALSCINRHLFNDRVNFWFNMVGNRLGNIADRLLGNLLTDCSAVVPDAESDFTLLMLVEHRRKRDHRLL